MEEHEKIGEKGQCLFNGFKPGDIPAEVQNLPEVKVLKIVWTQQFRAEAVANGVYGFEKNTIDISKSTTHLIRRLVIAANATRSGSAAKSSNKDR